MLALAGVATVAGLTSAGTPAYSADAEWKMHLVWVPTRMEVKEAERWANAVNARTGDKLKISIFPSGSLGVKDPDMLRILPGGNVIQVTMLYPGYVSRDAPELAFLKPEGVVDKPEEITKALPALAKIYDEVYGKWGVKYLATFISPDRSINIYCKEPVSSLEQLRQKKLRVWGKSLADAFSKVGVSATIIPQNDLYVAMQTGVVDCSTYYPGAANTLSLHEVAPNWSYLSDYVVPIQLIVSKKAWDVLPADVQSVLQEEASKLEEQLLAEFVEGTYEAAEAEKFDAAGGKRLDPFPKADQEAFTKAARDAWMEASKQIGGKTWENYQAISKVATQ